MYILYSSYARFNLEVKIERSGNKTVCQIREAHEKIKPTKNVKPIPRTFNVLSE